MFYFIFVNNLKCSVILERERYATEQQMNSYGGCWSHDKYVNILFSTTHFVLNRVNEQQEYQANTILNLKKNDMVRKKTNWNDEGEKKTKRWWRKAKVLENECLLAQKVNLFSRYLNTFSSEMMILYQYKLKNFLASIYV